ncbi:MAG: ankyrin repeat domain-containing protein [Elusimicrobiota bacterium]
MKKITVPVLLAALAAGAAGCFARRSPSQAVLSARLIESVRSGNVQAAQILLSQGADPNAAGFEGNTALMDAAGEGNVSLVRLLAAHGADVNRQGPSGETALVLAAENGYADVTGLLLKEGAPIRGAAAYKALMVSAAYGRVDVESLLLSNGVDPVGTMTRSIIALARRQGYDRAAQILETAISGEKISDKGSGQARIFNSAADAPSYREKRNPNNFALVVGVERYDQAGLPDALFARRDALAVQKHLIALGYPESNVKFLINQAASRASLEAYLEDWLPKNASANGTVFFYFSGHGASDSAGKTYLVPSDGNPEFLSKTGFPIDRLYADLQKLPAAHVIAALDACFSGSGERSVSVPGIRPLVTGVDWGHLAPDGRTAAFSAASGEQTAGVLPEEGHGIFTYYFLSGLNGAARVPDGITIKSLYDYITPRVEKAAARQNRGQTPQVLPAPLGALGALVIRP